MGAMPEALYQDVTSALRDAGRADLVARLERYGRDADALTTGQAAKVLGVSSANTVKNWLEAGHFPGAYRTPGGHWRFALDEVEAVKRRMDVLREKNQRGDLIPADLEDDEGAPPLL